MSTGPAQPGGRPLHERVSAALDAAGDATGTTLIELIASTHPHDEELLAEVRALLGAGSAASGVLDAGPAQAAHELAKQLHDRLLTSELFTRGGSAQGGGVGGSAVGAEGASVQPVPQPMPARIGAYEVVGVLGQGGMGLVYEAVQASPRRRVALKVLSSAVPSRGALARFRREAEALGRLKHPGIAQVFEAATDGGSGVSFFAMELVRGRTLTEHARAAQLDAAQRVELLAQVCDAVQHAHQAGIIHRDLKPSNILVEVGSEGQSQPKVLDFGVATMTQDGPGGGTLSLDAGRIIGTLGYMAPEAFDGQGAAADTRSDVYALGVLLHELLSGELPVEVRGASLTEAARRVREQAPAPLAALPAGTERAMASDLGIIAQRALEKEPAARYASAGELAADLRRCLRHEPILARPPSAMYLLRRFVRRRRAMAVGVAVAGALVVAAGLVAGVQYTRAQRARVLASEQRDQAQRGQYRVALFAASVSQRTGNASGARRALAETPRALRGWEWEYLSSSMRVGEIVTLPTLAERVHVPASGDVVLVEARDAARRSYLLHVPSRRVVGELLLRGAQMLMPNVQELGGDALVAGEATRGVECYRVSEGGAAAQLLWSRPAAEGARVYAVEADPTGRWGPGFVVLDGAEVVWVDAMSGHEQLRVAQVGRTLEAQMFERSGPASGLVLEFELVLQDAGAGSDQLVLRQLDFASRRLGAIERRSPARTLRTWYSGPQRWYVSRDFAAPSGTLLSRPDAMWATSAVSDRSNAGGETLVAMTDTRGAVMVYSPDPSAPDGVRERATLLASDSIVRRLVFTHDGEELLGIDASGVLQVLGADRARDPWRSVAEEHEVPGAVSADGTRALSVSWGSATMLDTLTGFPLWRVNFGREQPVASAICPRSGMVACFMGRRRSHEAFLLDGATGQVLRAFGERAWLPEPGQSVAPSAPWERSVRDAVFIAEGKGLVLLHEDGTLGALESESLAYRVISPPPKPGMFGRDLALSHDGSMLAVVSTDGNAERIDAAPIRVFRTRDMGVIAEVDAGAALCAAFGFDGKGLLVGRADGSLCAFDTRTWRRRWCAPPTADEWLSSIAVSPDGARIAAAGLSPSIRIFDGMGNHMTSLATVVPLAEPRVFTQDGALIASAVGVHTLRFDTQDTRTPQSWTAPAMDAWPDDIPRPASVAEARLLVQRVDEAARSVSRMMGTFAERERAAVLALPGGERDAAAPLLRVWLRRVGFHANWSNSDAILTTQHAATSEAELRSVVAMLDELHEHRPLRDGFAINAMGALARLGELEAGIERLARVDAAWERAGLVPDARRELIVLRALAERPGAVAAAMARVPRVQASIDAVGDEQARAGLRAELAAIVAGLGGSR